MGGLIGIGDWNGSKGGSMELGKLIVKELRSNNDYCSRKCDDAQREICGYDGLICFQAIEDILDGKDE